MVSCWEAGWPTVNMDRLSEEKHSSKYNSISLTLRQNGCHFADDIFKCIFLNENICILLKILLKFVLKGWMKNIPALVQIMAWRRLGDRPIIWTNVGESTEEKQFHVLGRDHFVYVPNQWQTTLQCNVVSYWLGTYTKWSLFRWALLSDTVCAIPNLTMGNMDRLCEEKYFDKHALGEYHPPKLPVL